MKDFDLSAYLGVFLDEVDEQLQILDSQILELEKDPKRIDTIQNIFRAAHTLKGSSASMGFEQMKEFTHHLESIFELIRSSRLNVTSELINVIFESIDFIKELKQAIVNGTLETIDITAHVNKLSAFKNSEGQKEKTIHAEPHVVSNPKHPLDEFQKNIIQSAMLIGHHALEITIRIVESAIMKNVRALLIHNNLKEAGEIVATYPSVEVMESDENFDDELCFVLVTTQTKQEVMHIINQISDIRSVSINDLTGVEHEEKEMLETTVVSQTSQPQTGTSKAKVNPTVRVDVDKLEHLMNLVGELVIDQTRLVDVRSRLTGLQSRSEEDIDILDEVTNHLSRVITELQEGMMKTRMLPIEQLFNRFPRMVRDTAQKANKDINFIMQGKETELDRTLIEEISDPIIHLLRNSIDHGVESPEERKALGKPKKGRIELRAAHEENHIVISISDDGRGIDPQKVKESAIRKQLITEEDANKMAERDLIYLIFKSGFSTAEKVTDVSGRGVGMDIVRSHIEKLNGIIDIDTAVGAGTTFTIKLPLTLAIIRSLLVKFGSKTFAIPLVNVLEIIRLNKEEIQMVKDKEVGLVRGRVLPLVRMKERLGIQEEGPGREKKREFVIVVGIADKRIGLIADKTLGNQEIVIKSLGSYIGSPPYITGATIMGDGSVALILDVSRVVREEGTQDDENLDNNRKKELEDEGQFVTFKLDKEEYGIDIGRAKDIVSVPTIVKVVNSPKDLLGLINLRGTMLPVIDLRERFNLPQKAQTKSSRIIVVEEAHQDIGILVDEVTEVLKTGSNTIEKPPAHNQYNQSKFIKGISKLGNRVVILLEFDEVLSTINTEQLKEHLNETVTI
ncbi:chemotaxis protein CheW [Bacillus sp. 31A1R]|uniref:Chemotaxis protein CheA n=1 Tax=Robertmurraya mangrovi TaxID=3098077 RepID=A0ABU5J414_9BACI|nr:chemotaxis protein CheW [Bacillus sp. 31A1R]MDZ5474107.1 chemotaxis protein CheW [Bacillus sp. 31A1R]